MVRERLSTAGGGVAAVRVVTKEELPYGCPAFTCRLRICTHGRTRDVQCGGRRPGVSVALCDAWRLESGGFAWRLDVEAALSLAPAKGS
ncbi:hypothetical protein MLD38_001060 [Melastoma candidum]|uniref:Uncharacterized protein n=1 Tax=Melastoma candidum TaxID=119954 RepID=A0ACB9SDC7_9MYRT|nr:hypothetical protein MLD38_001060 [Melastoma candidum]